LDLPKVGSIFGAVEAMRRSFAPAVKGQLKATHEILPGQHWVQFVPDDRLAEIQTVRGEYRRKYGKINGAAPDVVRAALLQRPSQVAEPRFEQTLVHFGRDGIIGQRPIPGPKLAPAGRLLIGRYDRGNQTTMARCLERAEAGGDGVVAPRFHV